MRLNTVGQLATFLEGTPDVDFWSQGNDSERYGFIASVVARLAYRRLGRGDEGVVRRYLGRTTGYSRPQLTRLIGRCLKGHKLAKRYRRPTHGFPRKYTAADVTLPPACTDQDQGPAIPIGERRAPAPAGRPGFIRIDSVHQRDQDGAKGLYQ